MIHCSGDIPVDPEGDRSPFCRLYALQSTQTRVWSGRVQVARQTSFRMEIRGTVDPPGSSRVSVFSA